ncbi:MAG: Hsp20/alpha crystallin family protein [Gammaproteobacteria bacterium]
MPLYEFESWMWAEACEMLNRSDRLHRQFFRPSVIHKKCATWEPPVDVYETRDEFIIMMALPGVAPEHINIVVDNNHLIISGQRRLPLRAEADIRRLEIPYGRFERAIELPSEHFELTKRDYATGCLYLTLRKK